MDSGIKTDPELLAEITKMEKYSKSPYDFIVMGIRQIDPEAKPKGATKPKMGVFATEFINKGTCEEKHGGEKVDGLDSRYYEVVQYIKENRLNTPCFVLVYVLHTKADGVSNNKLVLLVWTPDTSSVNEKMTYASTKDSLKKKINTAVTDCQCNDVDDLKFDNILAKLNK